MTNPIEPARWPVPRRLLPMAAARPARALMRGAASLAAWARLTNGSLRLDGADAVTPLDRQSRGLLWHVLTETIAAIGVLASPDVPAEAALAALATLADRVRDRVSLSAPSGAAPFEGTEAPHLFLLEILTRDLQPCLYRWLPRLEAWRHTGRPLGDWSLAGLCRTDLARTRDRLVERGWQLGVSLGLSGLERLLPPRPATVPALAAADELAAAEAAEITPLDPASRQAGWRIYIEAATRLPAPDQPSGPGALGDAIARLDALASEIRAALAAMPPPNGASAGTIPALAFGLLTEGIEPFLAEWRPRHRKFAASERPEAKWRRAEECRAALLAARERCLPNIRTLGVKIGAPPWPPVTVAAAAEGDAPLQLPPPATRS